MIVEFSINSSSFPSGSCGLGDVVSTIYALENVGRQRGVRFGVCFDQVFDPTGPFLLNHVFKSAGGLDLVRMIAELDDHGGQGHKGLFFGGFFICSMLNFMVKTFGYEPIEAWPIEPKRVTSASDVVFAQMDGRCAMVQHRDITMKQKKNILSKAKNVRLLGGLETNQYLGEEFFYENGDFFRVSELMASAKMFIGTDSGMSHLAGFLGTRSRIYIPGNIELLKSYYRRSYRNCSVVGFPFL